MLTFEDLRAANVPRKNKWHPPGSIPWLITDWTNAMFGECGELANVIKKIRRIETGTVNAGDPPYEVLRSMAAKEFADVAIYLDLAAEHLGIDLGEAVREKFNETSRKYGFPERL